MEVAVGFEQQIVQWLSAFAYQPYLLYTLIIVFMTASSFGLPCPEELVLVSSGLIAYSASRPDLYPPPSPDAAVVNPWVLATVCFLGVFLSDLLVFALGKYFGKGLTRSKRFGKWIDPEQSPKLESIKRKYGVLACGIFRFTPGIRFPGHLSCGVMGVSYFHFILIDGTAALLTVPTQVLGVAFYGELMLGYLKQFKIVLVAVGGVALAVYLGYRLYQYLNKRFQPVTKAVEAAAGADVEPLVLVHSVSSDIKKPEMVASGAAVENKRVA